MVVQAQHRKGRHARAVAGASSATRRLPSLAGSRRAQVVLGGATGLGLVLVVALVTTGSGRAPRAAAVDVLAGRQPPVSRSSERQGVVQGAGDESALAYFRAGDKVDASHVDKIVWTGPMLRVYTDLPASKADSKAAIALCEAGAAYLEGHGRIPMVFVHAGRSAGYPVLANKLDAGDDCRLNSVP